MNRINLGGAQNTFQCSEKHVFSCFHLYSESYRKCIKEQGIWGINSITQTLTLINQPLTSTTNYPISISFSQTKHVQYGWSIQCHNIPDSPTSKSAHLLYNPDNGSWEYQVMIFFAQNIIGELKHIPIPALAESSTGVASDHRSGEATNNEELPPPYSPGDFGRRFFRSRQQVVNNYINALLLHGERSARHTSRERAPRSGAMSSLPASRSRYL